MGMSTDIEKQTIPLGKDADGVLRVSGTRVTLETLVAAFQDGATPEEIAQQYASIPLADIYAVLGYYLNHRSSVDAYLRGRQADRAKIQMGNESRFGPNGIRERLLSRRGHDGGKP